MCSLSVDKNSSWSEISQIICSTIPNEVQNCKNISEVVKVVLNQLSSLKIIIGDDHDGVYSEQIDLAGSALDKLSLELERIRMKRGLEQKLQQTALYQTIKNISTNTTKDMIHSSTILLLSLPSLILKLRPELLSEWENLLKVDVNKQHHLSEEIGRISQQVSTMINTHCLCGNRFKVGRCLLK